MVMCADLSNKEELCVMIVAMGMVTDSTCLLYRRLLAIYLHG